jgi:2-C-methyl-D-erythritol 4-phosphate cytidylyltransferase
MDSGSEVHSYLESELGEYYYRDEDSLIRATPEAVTLVDGDADPDSITVSPLQEAVVSVLAGADEEPDSVVATLHALRGAGRDPTVDEVRSALRSLVDKGVVERVQRTVPTYRLAASWKSLDLETREE